MLPFLVGPAAHLTEIQVRFMADLVFITRTFLPIFVPDRSLTVISTLFVGVLGFFFVVFFVVGLFFLREAFCLCLCVYIKKPILLRNK